MATNSSSLALLLPKQYAQAASFTSTTKFDHSETAALLEANSRAVIDSINNRNYAAAELLVANSYRSELDGIAKNASYDEDRQSFVNISKQNPDYHVELLNVAADVDEKTGYAIVYCLMNVTGQPCNIKRQTVSAVEWMRRDGKWLFYSTTTLRGLDGTGLPGDVQT